MDEYGVRRLLDQLESARDEAEVVRMWTEEASDALIPAEVKQALADLRAEIAPRQSEIAERIAELEAQVKQAALEYGESVKGARLQVVFAKGRTSWDTKALDDYAAAHPEIERFRKVGDPTVSIRTK